MTEARNILSKVAKVNGKCMPEEAIHLPNDEKIERLGDFPDLFMSAGMVHRTLASWLMWQVFFLIFLPSGINVKSSSEVKNIK